MQQPWDPDSDNLPKLSELPAVPDGPKHASWFWGENDQLGRINLLTPRRVKEAAKLIQTGERACMNLDMDLPGPPLFGRQAFKHTLVKTRPYAFDDLYDMNTQSSSQWDGLRHAGIKHKDGYIWYNNTTDKQIEESGRLGIDSIAQQGIVGRGVLVDYYRYRNESYDPLTTVNITADDIKACAKAQGVEFQYGDILIVRTGVSKEYPKLDQAGREAMSAKAYLELTFAGLSRDHSTVEFLHDKYFSAVASDTPAFESWPMTEPDHLHHFLLPLWGCPIGELWDLEGISELCKKHNRYTFFLASSPAKVKGGVATSPNVVGVF